MTITYNGPRSWTVTTSDGKTVSGLAQRDVLALLRQAGHTHASAEAAVAEAKLRAAAQ